LDGRLEASPRSVGADAQDAAAARQRKAAELTAKGEWYCRGAGKRTTLEGVQLQCLPEEEQSKDTIEHMIPASRFYPSIR